jgi:multiple sugar transport system substrate-binding protein
MTLFTRRDALQIGAGALAGSTMLASGSLRAQVAVKDVAPPKFEIEEGASLRVLRPSKFVQGDETLFLENSKKFTDATGVQVTVTSESWEDLRPKTATAAAIGSGPDIVCAWSDDPHKFASQCVDLTDLATYLGDKYGGWWPIVEKYGRDQNTGKWIAMPIGGSGNRVVYRKSWVGEAGYETVPGDLDGFLAMARKLKANGHPIGFALGNATGDGNSWCHWLMWTHGGSLTDEDNQVTINSKETIEALKYGKALAETFIPGAASWLDPSNNKAFLAGEVSATGNGISIYYAAKNSQDAAVKAMSEDIFHARMPIGPAGRPTERALIVNPMVFTHSKYPNAAKEYLRFMMEEEQYLPWLTASIGYWNHPLQAYDKAPIWTDDPKHEPYQHVLADAIWDGYRGDVGEASAATTADFVVVQMVASVATGQATPEEAAAEAERRARRYYKS